MTLQFTVKCEMSGWALYVVCYHLIDTLYFPDRQIVNATYATTRAQNSRSFTIVYFLSLETRNKCYCLCRRAFRAIKDAILSGAVI